MAIKYCVEYRYKGNTEWRQSMWQPLSMMNAQREELNRNPWIEETRFCAVESIGRDLNEAEALEAAKGPSIADLEAR